MKTLKNKFQKYKAEHRWFRILIEYGVGIIVCALSAFVLTIAMKSFVAPNQNMLNDGVVDHNLPRIIAGGANGISQVITKIIQMIFNVTEQIAQILQYVFYVVVNIPLVIIAFIKIGKKFAAFSLLNVLLTFTFTFLPSSFFDSIAVVFEGQFLTRAVFGGALVGLSSGIAFRFDQSAGGIDIIGHLLAARKSALTGRYGLMINAGIMVTFVVLSFFKPDTGQMHAMEQMVNLFNNGTGAVYADVGVGTRLGFFTIIILTSLLYLIVSSFVVDLINLRNKKEQIQITTKNKDLPAILLASFNHGVTTVKGKGEYTQEEKIIIFMTVSHYETESVVRKVKEVDPEAFTNVLSLRQVYGRFFIPPIK